MIDKTFITQKKRDVDLVEISVEMFARFIQLKVQYAEDIASEVSFLPIFGTLAITSPVTGFRTCQEKR